MLTTVKTIQLPLAMIKRQLTEKNSCARLTTKFFLFCLVPKGYWVVHNRPKKLKSSFKACVSCWVTNKQWVLEKNIYDYQIVNPTFFLNTNPTLTAFPNTYRIHVKYGFLYHRSHLKQLIKAREVEMQIIDWGQTSIEHECD